MPDNDTSNRNIEEELVHQEEQRSLYARQMVSNAETKV